MTNQKLTSFNKGLLSQRLVVTNKPTAFQIASEQIFRDWHSGQPLADDFEGEFWLYGAVSGRMLTWIDKETSERCYRGIPNELDQ